MRLSLYGLVLGILFPSTIYSQGLFGARYRPANHFSGTQWYVGVTTGISRTQVVPLQRYSEFSPIPTSTTPDKDYQAESHKTGHFAGLTTMVACTPYLQLTLSAQHHRLKYTYRQSYVWEDPERETNRLQLDDAHHHALDYVEFPLQVRYTFPIHRLKPFVQGGISYGRLISAHKTLVSTSTDYASGEATPSIRRNQGADVRSLYIKSHAAYTLGAGAAYNFGGLMLTAEVNYRRGLHNLTDVKTRYTASRSLNGLGRVPDDIKTNALTGSISALFPLKFLTDKDFKPVIF